MMMEQEFYKDCSIVQYYNNVLLVHNFRDGALFVNTGDARDMFCCSASTDIASKDMHSPAKSGEIPKIMVRVILIP